MAIGDRITQWVNEKADEWGDRLGTWLLERVGRGIYKGFEDMEPGAIDAYRASLEKLRDDPLIPDDYKVFINKSLETGNPFSVGGGVILMILQIFGTILQGSQPLGTLIRYSQEQLLKTYRLDPIQAVNAWRRFPGIYDNVFEDLKDQGWSDDRIQALKRITEFLPTPQDLITWTAREVFEPSMRARYGLDDDAEKLTRDLFYKQGFDDEQINNYWAAHWEHSSFLQMVELIRRGLLTGGREVPAPPATPEEWDQRDRQGLEQLYDWYTLVEIAPYWRNLLSELVWEVPTRVDVRRWWDMRVISEDELRSVYHRQGYHGVDLENYIKWTKVYTDYPVLIARWQNGWINEDDVREYLRGLGIPEDRVQQFIEEKISPEEPARVEEGRALTKAEIYKGVKQGKISREEGIELIMDLGYNRAEAEYLLDINVEVLSGSPETFEQFKDLTSKYRRATGKESAEMPEDLKAAADELVRITNEVNALEESVKAEESNLVDVPEIPPEAEAHLKELRVFLNRALNEKARIQGEYDRLVAEFKQRGGTT